MIAATAPVESVPTWFVVAVFVFTIGWLAAGWIKEHYLD